MSSIRQQYLTELSTLPEWLQGLEDPVIRTPGQSNRMHRPDPRANEPKPACNTQGDHTTYVVTERDNIVATYDPCQLCFGGGDDE